MKKLIVAIVCTFLLTSTVFAAPGDEVSDHINDLWKIAGQANVLSDLVVNMNTVPSSYAATHSQNDWVTWLKMEIAMDFGKVFYAQVYVDIVDKIVGYNYANARIDDQYKPPQNVQVSTGEITCDEDPTGESRTVLLYQRVSGRYTEQSVSGSLDTGTWTFSSVPAGSNYVLAYDDAFASFPTEHITVP